MMRHFTLTVRCRKNRLWICRVMRYTRKASLYITADGERPTCFAPSSPEYLYWR